MQKWGIITDLNNQINHQEKRNTTNTNVQKPEVIKQYNPKNYPTSSESYEFQVEKSTANRRTELDVIILS